VQVNRDSQEQLSHSSCKEKVVMDAEGFPRVDVCVLFPNVFSPQEVINDPLLSRLCNYEMWQVSK